MNVQKKSEVTLLLGKKLVELLEFLIQLGTENVFLPPRWKRLAASISLPYPAIVFISRFLDYMEEVKPSLAKSNISIAYKAERSVSDEIERQSTWGFNSKYIIIAYLVIFVYVTYAFSEFFSWERVMVIKKLLNNDIVSSKHR